jgi:uncharacterized membrane protein YphA (DoxX/SURF4 family)
MASKSSCGSFGPVFLRLCLGIVFIWAGLGKVIGTTVVKGADAAALKEMGVTPKTATVQGASGTPAPENGDSLEVSNAYLLALMLKNSSKPAEGASRALWPQQLSDGRLPVYCAYACVLTELVGGALVLVGALTRLCAFGIATVMATAMWLTQIGPAVASGKTKFGFLPDIPAFGPGWDHLFLQFSLFSMAMALVWLGCGTLGLDRVLFRPPPPPKPKPQPVAAE